jgi:hypothetical protein
MAASRSVLFVLGLGVALGFPLASAEGQVTRIPPGVVSDPNAKLINISGSTQVFYKGENIKLSVLRAAAGTCSEVRLTLDGKSRTASNVAFPWTFEITPKDALYPTKNAKLEMVVEGVTGCTGRVAYTFAFNTSEQGVIDGIVMTGFGGTTPDAAQVVIQGHGLCRVHVSTWPSPYEPAKSTPYELIQIDPPTRLPLTVPLKRTGAIAGQYGGDHVVRILTLGIKSTAIGVPDDASKKAYPGWEGCVIKAGGNAWSVVKTFSTTKAPSQTSGSGRTAGGGAGTPGGGGLPSSPKPANGNIVSMLVPGGSFAEDEAQKIQVNGKGGCGFDLVLSNKTYGGSTEKTENVLPMRLDNGATLYNGTHFGTLAEGSWKATATGKNGCTGTATIDFKVTAKASTKKVLGKLTLGFDQPPKSGGVFTSKDSNIWFKVLAPQSVKGEPGATCCDLEFDFMNEYGGWEALPNSPFSDSSYAGAVQGASGVAMRSVSYFSNGTQWRVKMKASKFKTEFEWSDWLEFKVDQH